MFEFDHVTRFGRRHRHDSVLRGAGRGLVRRQRSLTRTVGLLVRITVVICNLVDEVANATILHFDLLNFLVLIGAAAVCWRAIGLVELTLCLSVIAFDSGACGSALRPIVHRVFLGLLLLLHGHEHVLVEVELLDGFLI